LPVAGRCSRADRELAVTDAAKLPAAQPGNLLTVAIATYEGRELLETALPSLAGQSFRDFRVLVVDNASEDETVEWLRERWPEVEVVVHERNLGVTASLNTCLRMSRTALVGLFNNDIELDPHCLQELVDAMHEHPAAGWACAKLIDFHQRDVLDGAGDVFSWLASAERRGHGQRDRGQYDEPRAIFGACGAAAVYRRSALEDVGPFDEDFFAIYEDVDWDLRAHLAGFDCRYVPSAVVYHMGGATIGSGLTDFACYQQWRNTLWIIAKDLPADALLRHAPQLLLGQLIVLATAVRDRRLGVWLRAWRDALRAMPNVMRKRREVQARRRVELSGLEAVIEGGAPIKGINAS
jgi:GT2 family glycosyltransferase